MDGLCKTYQKITASALILLDYGTAAARSSGSSGGGVLLPQG